MAIECKGDCFNCLALKNDEVDAVVCPIRIIMKRTEKIMTKMEEIIGYVNIKQPNKIITDIDVTEEINIKNVEDEL